MRQGIFFIIGLLLFGSFSTQAQQQSSYDSAWAKVAAAEKKGLTQDAWTAVKKIYRRARSGGDHQQQLKALIYQLKYRQTIAEEALITNIAEVDSLMQTASGLPRSLLTHLDARLYLSYARQNRYRLQNRTPSAAEQAEGPDSWSLPHFYRHIDSLFQSALRAADSLQKIPVKDLSVLVTSGKNGLQLRPTLYDLMAQDALAFYTQESDFFQEPVTAFAIDQPEALEPASAFSRFSFGPADHSPALRALQLFQQLIGFHLKNGPVEALIDVDLQRIRYVHKKGVMAGKDSLYVRALEHLMDHYAVPAKFKATALLAQWYVQQGAEYDAKKKPEHQWALKKALDLCNQVPDSLPGEGALACRQLKDRILQPAIGLNVESVNIPEQPFRVRVSYKNLEDLWFKIVRLKNDPQKIHQSDPDWATLQEKTPVARWQQTFPLPADHQEHAAEMKVNALPAGRYALLAAADSGFHKGNNPIVSVDFQVSGLSYVTDDRGGFLVLDRESGKPVKGAHLRLWERVYNQSKRRYDIKEAGKYKTDANGYVQVHKKKAAYFMPEIITSDDRLFLDAGRYIVYNQASSSPTTAARTEGRLYTDRAIYRPGQQVRFKGLLFTHTAAGDNQVQTDKKVKVRLYDANYRAIDSATFTSNRFGSFAGSFPLPAALLAGRMHLAIDSINSQVFFRMEDYKRPTFELHWDSSAMHYQLGDTVTVGGSLEGYNGAALGQATLHYEVVRKQYIRPYYRGYSNARSLVIYPVKTTVVAQGSAQARADGHFQIPFAAIPDKEVPAGKRIFNYEITVDVTDISGESHPFSYQLPIGDQSLLLQLDMPTPLLSRALDTLQLRSTDLKGQFTPVPIAVSLYALQAPDRFVRDRYWPAPDQHLMDKEAFVALFPHDEYDNEALPENWPVNHPVYVARDTTAQNGHIPFYYGKLIPGWYLLKVVAKDNNGQFVSDSQYLQVFDPADNHLPFHQVLWASTTQQDARAGQQARWWVGSSEKAYVFEKTERAKDIAPLHPFRLNNRLREELYTPGDQDHGGVIRHYVAVRYNRLFTRDVRLELPWTDQQLRISYASFRDKIRPGEKETWTVEISGQQTDTTTTELLASMYDASLDYFAPHHWDPLGQLYAAYYGKINWKGNDAFSKQSDRPLYTPKPKTYPPYTVIYPSFRDFGYPFGGGRFYAFDSRVALHGRVAGLQAESMPAQAAAAPAPAENKAADAAVPVETQQASSGPVSLRQDFRETAFFYPQLHTDSTGRVTFSFTVPDALTRWHLQLLAHSPDMKIGYAEKTVRTQKPLMIQLQAPRFLRQGDQVQLQAKISNLSPNEQSGQAALHFLRSRDSSALPIIRGSTDNQTFHLAPGQSQTVSWQLAVPDDFSDALTYRLEAHSDAFTDGEQQLLPVLSNRSRITESLPLQFSGNGDHALHWDALGAKGSGSTDRQPEALTIEYTANPIWYAVQALPFLDDNPRKSADVLFQKVYAQALSRYIALKIPDFKSVMESWRTADSQALKSPLQQNQALKNILLEETPWVLQARDEAAGKAAVAQWYLDESEQLRLQAMITQLQALQMDNGGFAWFKGMTDSRQVTQSIVTGLGHLQALHSWPHAGSSALRQMVQKAVPYLDARMTETYQRLRKQKNDKTGLQAPDIQYLYMRSFFTNLPMADSCLPAYRYYFGKAAADWTSQSPEGKAMLALVFQRADSTDLAAGILESIRQTAIQDPVAGMHWKTSTRPFGGYHRPVATQVRCLEAFHALGADTATVNALRWWLLRQKQTQFWGTEQATADALYGLLLTGSDWSTTHPQVEIQLGSRRYTLGADQKGLQYEKIRLPAESLAPDMQDIRVNITGAASDQPSWGALYFQYFAPMQQVDAGKDGALSLQRQISRVTQTGSGSLLTPLTTQQPVAIGDKVMVRLLVRVERDLDFVHLKDVRASCMEPLQVSSGYQWNKGVGYYETTTDAAVHFYFQHLPKGTYVFSYPAYITQQGSFTGGLAQIECLYAPEIRAHSAGTTLLVR